VLDYSLIPGTNDQILITLDTSFNVATFNQKAAQKPAAVAEDDISQEQREEMKKSYRIVQIASDGSVRDLSFGSYKADDQFTDITSSHPLQSTLDSIITSPTNQTTSKDLSTLNLYPDLSLFPRWPGLEEDDDLAGPSTDPIPSDPTPTTGVVMEPSGPRKEYTHEEYQVMNLKHLGRLKAQGYKVDDYMRTKRRETKDRRFEAKRARLDAGLEVGGDEEEEGEGEELSNA
jgi:tRNA (guanine-N(7)-)-methyltransferase subunit TRM82